MSSTSSQAGSSGPKKGPEGVQHMLEGQDNRKLAGAKEALKKKILRLVMQEAMEELGDSQSLADKSIQDIGIDPADMERLNEGVRKHLIRRAAQEVTELDLDEISEAAAQAALDNAEVDEAAGRVEQKLLDVVSEKVIGSLSEDGSTVKKAFESISEANASAIEDLADSVQDRLCGAIAAKAWSNGIDADRVVEMAAEKIDADNASVSDAITRIQASAGDMILHHVLAQLSGEDATTALADEVSRRFKERMLGVVTERVSADPESIAKELESEFGPQHEAVVAASRKTRAHLIGLVKDRALASVQDARAAAREAMVEIDEDHKQIVEATTALARKLTQSIADRAMTQLGDAETAAAAALKIARESEQVIVTAANSVYETMARHVAEDARERCSDPDQLADAARDYMDPKDASISRAVSLVQTRLTELVANRAIASLDEDDRMRQLAREAAKREGATVQKSVEEIREQIMDDIVRQVGQSFLDAGETARKAKARMGEGNAAVIAASEVLKELVLEELAKQATFTLLEPEKTGAKAFERIDIEDPRFVQTTEKVKEKLIRTIAEHSLNTLTESEEAAERARQHISDTDATIVSATAVLRDHLISEIAKRGTDELSDTRAVARQSRGRIEADNESIANASRALRELLIEDMVEMTRSALSDAETAAQEAMSHLDQTDEVFDRIRAVFKERVLINVLGEAMREIGQSVAGPGQEAAMFQQALHAMTSRDSARAGAWNGNGYQPTPPPASASRPVDSISATPPSLSVSPSASLDMGPDNWSAPRPGTQAPARPRPASTYEEDVAIADPDTEMDDWGAGDLPVLPGESASTDGWVRLSDIEDPASDDRMVALTPPEPMDDMIVTEFVDHDEEPEAADSKIKFEVTLAGEPAEWPTSSAKGKPTAGAPSAKAPAQKPAASTEAAKSPSPKSQEAEETDEDMDMTWGADDGTRCYVYGYVSAPEIGAKPPKGLTGLDEKHTIRFVTLRGVRAIVSKVSAKEFDSAALEKKSKDADWVKARIRDHATVLDAFKSQGTVMPVRFGSVFDNEADVAVMMSSEYDHVVDTLERLKGKQEWSLRIMRDSEVLSARLASSERTVEDSLGAISTGVAQFIKDEMEKSGELVDDSLLETTTENCIRRTHDALMPWAVDGAQKALFTAPGVDMVFNAAYLVETGKASDFQDEIERLSKEMEHLGLTMDLTGPWPAYHFVDADEDGSATLAPVMA